MYHPNMIYTVHDLFALHFFNICPLSMTWIPPLRALSVTQLLVWEWETSGPGEQCQETHLTPNTAIQPHLHPALSSVTILWRNEDRLYSHMIISSSI